MNQQPPINLTCPEHGKLIEGLCVEKDCLHQSRAVCFSCILINTPYKLFDLERLIIYLRNYYEEDHKQLEINRQTLKQRFISQQDQILQSLAELRQQFEDQLSTTSSNKQTDNIVEGVLNKELSIIDLENLGSQMGQLLVNENNHYQIAEQVQVGFNQAIQIINKLEYINNQLLKCKDNENPEIDVSNINISINASNILVNQSVPPITIHQPSTYTFIPAANCDDDIQKKVKIQDMSYMSNDPTTKLIVRCNNIQSTPQFELRMKLHGSQLLARNCKSTNNIELYHYFWDNRLVPLQSLIGHTDMITSIDFNSNNKAILIASSSKDHTIKLWAISNYKKTYTLCQTLTEHKGSVNQLAFNHNGAMLVSAGSDYKIILWKDTHKYQDSWIQFQVLSGHQDAVNAITINNDSTLMASGSSDTTIIIWCSIKDQKCEDDNEQWKQLTTLFGKAGCIKTLAFSGQYLAAGNCNNTIAVWCQINPNIWQCVNVLVSHTDVINHIKSTSIPGQIISCSSDGTLKLWNNISSEYQLQNLQQLRFPLYGFEMYKQSGKIIYGDHTNEFFIQNCRVELQ